MCLLTWPCSVEDALNAAPHFEHLYGFSPERQRDRIDSLRLMRYSVLENSWCWPIHLCEVACGISVASWFGSPCCRLSTCGAVHLKIQKIFFCVKRHANSKTQSNHHNLECTLSVLKNSNHTGMSKVKCFLLANILKLVFFLPQGHKPRHKMYPCV